MTAVAEAPVRISPTAVFKKRDFVLMWVAQLVSTAGSSLTDLAAGIYVYSVTGSAFLVGVTLMATAVPSLVVGLIAGVFVDRYDRRSVMIWTCLVQAVVVGLIPFLLGINPYLLFVAILVNAGVKQFFDPAYESLIPEIAIGRGAGRGQCLPLDRLVRLDGHRVRRRGPARLCVQHRVGVLDRLADVRRSRPAASSS